MNFGGFGFTHSTLAPLSGAYKNVVEKTRFRLTWYFHTNSILLLYWQSIVLSEILPWFYLLDRFKKDFQSSLCRCLSSVDCVSVSHMLILCQMSALITSKFTSKCHSRKTKLTSQYNSILKLVILTHYSPVLFFYTPWKHQKILFSILRGYRKLKPGCNGLK